MWLEQGGIPQAGCVLNLWWWVVDFCFLTDWSNLSCVKTAQPLISSTVWQVFIAAAHTCIHKHSIIPAREFIFPECAEVGQSDTCQIHSMPQVIDLIMLLSFYIWKLFQVFGWLYILTLHYLIMMFHSIAVLTLQLYRRTQIWSKEFNVLSSWFRFSCIVITIQYKPFHTLQLASITLCSFIFCLFRVYNFIFIVSE